MYVEIVYFWKIVIILYLSTFWVYKNINALWHTMVFLAGLKIIICTLLCFDKIVTCPSCHSLSHTNTHTISLHMLYKGKKTNAYFLCYNCKWKQRKTFLTFHIIFKYNSCTIQPYNSAILRQKASYGFYKLFLTLPLSLETYYLPHVLPI